MDKDGADSSADCLDWIRLAQSSDGMSAEELPQLLEGMPAGTIPLKMAKELAFGVIGEYEDDEKTKAGYQEMRKAEAACIQEAMGVIYGWIRPENTLGSNQKITAGLSIRSEGSSLPAFVLSGAWGKHGDARDLPLQGGKRRGPGQASSSSSAQP